MQQSANSALMDHYLYPRNTGELDRPDAVGIVDTYSEDQILKLYVKMDDARQAIQEATFQSFGCPDAIAPMSVLTEILSGKNLEEAGALDASVLYETLGQEPNSDLPMTKCLQVLDDALQKLG